MFLRDLCKEKKVLDYGCGYGIGYLFFNGYCKSYTGIDLDEKAIKWAQKHLKSSNSDFCSVEEYSVNQNKSVFDVVISFEVMEHVRDVSSHLGFLSSETKTGRIIVLSTPNGLWSHGQRELFRTEYHVHEYYPEEIYELIRGKSKDVTFYKEKRRDRLDYLGLKITRLGNKSTSNNFDKTFPWKQRIMRSIFKLGYQLGNYSLFWRIVESEFDEMHSLDYSTIVVKIKKS